MRSSLENQYEGDGQEKAQNDKRAAPQKKKAQLMPSSDMVLVGAKGQARMVARVGGTASKQDSNIYSFLHSGAFTSSDAFLAPSTGDEFPLLSYLFLAPSTGDEFPLLSYRGLTAEERAAGNVSPGHKNTSL